MLWSCDYTLAAPDDIIRRGGSHIILLLDFPLDLVIVFWHGAVRRAYLRYPIAFSSSGALKPTKKKPILVLNDMKTIYIYQICF